VTLPMEDVDPEDDFDEADPIDEKLDLFRRWADDVKARRLEARSGYRIIDALGTLSALRPYFPTRAAIIDALIERFEELR